MRPHLSRTRMNRCFAMMGSASLLAPLKNASMNLDTAVVSIPEGAPFS